MTFRARFYHFRNYSRFQFKKMIWGHSDRALAQNFGVVLAVIAISAGEAKLATFCQDA